MNIDVNVKDYLSPGRRRAAGHRAGSAPSECGCDDACGLERVRYFPRQLLGADDLNAEQSYFREKLRRHNRYVHGWGVVCGCSVRSASTAEKPYQVLICPGYVITPCGDEIQIGCPALFDLETCMVSSDDPCAYARPCPPVTTTLPMHSKIYLSVCYKECEVRPVRLAPAGCSCDDVACDYSRIRDAYEFTCRDSLPGSERPPYTCDDLCHGGVFPCPPSPTENCVVLATIAIRGPNQEHAVALVAPPAPVMAIDDSTDRRLLYSTAMLQQMGWCQCGDARSKDLPIAATPDILSENTADDNVIVHLADSTPGASIHYTIDGSDPTSASSTYTDQIVLTPDYFANGVTVNVKAIAVAASYRDSEIASAEISANPIN